MQEQHLLLVSERQGFLLQLLAVVPLRFRRMRAPPRRAARHLLGSIRPPCAVASLWLLLLLMLPALLLRLFALRLALLLLLLLLLLGKKQLMLGLQPLLPLLLLFHHCHLSPSSIGHLTFSHA